MTDEKFAPVPLRGYGTVAGSFHRDANGGSVLTVTCEDDSKAKLLQAKYLSDLCDLPGVVRTDGADFSKYDVAGQGCIAAYCKSKTVQILAATSEKGLQELVAQLKPEGSTQSQVDVPMFLNRWDKYGWRFYYRHRPLQAPKGYDYHTYDFFKDFDDAKAFDHSGFVFWNFGNPIDGVEGLVMESEWSWAAKAAGTRGLPIAVNSGNELGSGAPFLLNRYPEQTQQKAPDFVGNFHKVADPYLGGQGTSSWCSDVLNDAGLGIIQQSLHGFQNMPSLVSYMEPHQELFHGESNILFEYGPVADASYRDYLKAKYKTIETLNQRWFGVAGKMASWDDVRVPEVASFLGWNSKAIDLKGEWAVGYEDLADPHLVITRQTNDALYNKPIKSKPAPADWFSAGFNDSSWPRIIAPGNDQEMFLQHRPAVFRREFVLDENRLHSEGHWWLYVWDLNDAFQPADKMMAFVNGQKVGESLDDSQTHWAAFDVTAVLRGGANQLALRLPKGYLGYRVYLSPDEPKIYPELGAEQNAKWEDFVNWTSATRAEQVRRGIEMIRQVDPNRQITLAAPDHYADNIKSLAEDYGGEFHNTGYMGVFYADYLPGLMQGANLPFSVELGEPAKDLAEFKKTMGLYLMENTQSVDYYSHVGYLLWDPAMRKNFEDNLRLYHLFGKYHAPKAQAAVLFSTESQALAGFPWSRNPNINLASTYYGWNIASPLRGTFDYDFLSESSFASGDAAQYPVIIDSNTSIISDELLSQIEEWVRQGGIFITSGETGRHTPTGFDQWPISKLSGYKVVRRDDYLPNGQVNHSHALAEVDGQQVFSKQWAGVTANGLGLKGDSPDCQDLMRWDDGSTAVGMRKLGKGMVIHVGVRFGGAADLPERIELNPQSQPMKMYSKLYTQILDSLHIPESELKVPGQLVWGRHYISNNGLYDVWGVWNENQTPVATQLHFNGSVKARAGVEVSTGATVNLVEDGTGAALNHVSLEALQSRAYLTPRNRIAEAARDWFQLQRNWWRGTRQPSAKPFPSVESLRKATLDLSNDWAFMPLNDSASVADASSAKTDDSTWKKMPLGIWTSDFPDVRRGVFRKTFHVPEAWTDGDVALWVQAWALPTFCDHADVYVDGTLLENNNSKGIAGEVLANLKPGTDHTISLLIEGQGALRGSLGGAWLSYKPRPFAVQSLAGEWLGSPDALHYNIPLTLPGKWDGWLAKRSVVIDPHYQGANVLIHYDGTADLSGVIINGRWIRQDHQQTAKEWFINITPWVKVGEENTIQMARLNGPATGLVKTLEIDFYKPGVYP